MWGHVCSPLDVGTPPGFLPCPPLQELWDNIPKISLDHFLNHPSIKFTMSALILINTMKPMETVTPTTLSLTFPFSPSILGL